MGQTRVHVISHAPATGRNHAIMPNDAILIGSTETARLLRRSSRTTSSPTAAIGSEPASGTFDDCRLYPLLRLHHDAPSCPNSV
jgi:hypothetical protein